MVSIAISSPVMPPPPTPIAKRPSLNLKRSSSYLDTDDEAGLSTATKKLKVAFNEHLDIRVLDDWNERSFDLIKEEVRHAIHRHLAPVDSRDDSPYGRILQVLSQDAFSSEAPSTHLLRKYIVALNSHISSLGNCGNLVMSVLDLMWVGRDEDFVDVYMQFLVVLASTHAKYLSPIIERLVSHFEKLPAATGRLPSEQTVTRPQMFDRIHSAIHTLLLRVPSTSGHLMRMLDLLYPKDLSTSRSYLQYQRHLLRIAREASELSSEILALIVRKVVNVDVQIQLEIEDLEDEDPEEKLIGGSRMRRGEDELEDSDDSDDEFLSESELSVTPEEQRLRDLRLKVTKLDGALDLLFEYYAPFFVHVRSPERNPAFQQLMSHFMGFIMANRCRHAQFLVFHFAQTAPAYAQNFAMFLIQTTGNLSTATNLRLVACAYLASFIARGSLISRPLVRIVFDALSTILEQFRQRYEPTCRGPNRRSYNVFYAVAQALLYIFCFRWRDLVDDFDPDDEDQLVHGRDLHWAPNVKDRLLFSITSPLNPLRVCSSAIVEEFARIAQHLRFVSVFSVIATNKKVRLGQISSYYRMGDVLDLGRRETAWDRKKGDEHHQLEAYFPFDPYHLPKSKRWLQDEYNLWTLPPGLKPADEDDADDEDDDESDDDSDDDSLSGELPLAYPLEDDAVSISS